LLNNNTGTSAGSVYFFEKASSGFWLQTQKVISQYPATGSSHTGFGIDVSIDSNTAVVGAEEELASINGATVNSGAAYIYHRSSNGIWLLSNRIIPSNGESADNFGKSVSTDGSQIVVGAYNHDKDTNNLSFLVNAGAAYIYGKNSSNLWVQQQMLVANDRRAEAEFGYSVSIDGGYLIIGARKDSVCPTGPMGGSQWKGSAYIFDQTVNNNWVSAQKLGASTCGDKYGSAVVIDNCIALVGAQWFDMAQSSMYPNGRLKVYANSNCATLIVQYINNVCPPTYISPSGKYVWTSDGVYYDTISNPINDTIVKVFLTFEAFDTNVVVSNGFLTALAPDSIYQYQWLDCSNNYSIITGETNSTFAPNTNGDYAVKLIKGGCADTSACYNISNVSIDKPGYNSSIMLFPNPSDGIININFYNTDDLKRICVYNSLGQMVGNAAVVKTQKQYRINLSGKPKGIYFIGIEMEGGFVFRKLVLE
jgi:hypothetical protein